MARWPRGRPAPLRPWPAWARVVSKVSIASSASIDAGSVLVSVKPSPVASARLLEHADAIDQAVEVLAQPRVGAGAVGRFEQRVEGAVELGLARARGGPSVSSCWPASKWRSDCGDQDRDRIRRRRRERRAGATTGAGALRDDLGRLGARARRASCKQAVRTQTSTTGRCRSCWASRAVVG